MAYTLCEMTGNLGERRLPFLTIAKNSLFPMILQWGDTSASLKNAIFLFKKNFAQIYRNQPEDRKGFNRPFF
jgi:hypothetical protein